MYSKVLNSIFRSIQKTNSDKLLYCPSKISIETGNICNLACPLCPTNDEAQKSIEKGLLSFKNFRGIFDEIKPFVKTIDLFSWGEPFLNKDIGDMIKYAKEKKPGLRIFIDSNLNVITDEQVETIVGNCLDVLKVSCDGVSQEVYHKYRKGGKVEAVMCNLNKILAAKKRLNSEKPHLIWKYLVFKHNQSEVEAARQKARELGIAFEANGMRVDCGKEIFEKVEDSVARDSEWIPDGEEYNNYTDLDIGKKTCGKPWKTLTVNWNGDVVPCGAIYDCGKYSFGNLLKQSFREVWNGEKFIAARRVIRGADAAKSNVICGTCKENGYQFF